MEQIVIESKIWDLHIHTNECPKADGFKKLTIEKYINDLLDLFKDYPSLEMISFTDHNKISQDVYENFKSKNHKITLLPGIEVDLYLSQVDKDLDILRKNYKHMIIYFDDKKFNIPLHTKKINDYLVNTPVVLNSFLDFLISEIKVPFAISPHFCKQGRRSIDFDWNDENVEKNIDKYMDQFFCFWESSGASNIAHANEFLKDFERDNRISIIEFSDGNNYNKIKDYLENPYQYFNALPTFDGLRLVGTDVRRIVKYPFRLNEFSKGSMIKEITFNGCNLKLSPKLNTIIGGRGSGKSLLLDSLMKSLNKTQYCLNKSREDYIGKYEILVSNGNDSNISNADNSSFRFDYFNQGYISTLFDNDKKDNNFYTYFKDEFTGLKTFQETVEKAEMLKIYKLVDKIPEVITDNLQSISSTVINLGNKKKELKIPRVGKKDILNYTKYSYIEKILSNNEIVPKDIKSLGSITDKLRELYLTINKEIFKYNNDNLSDNFLPYRIRELYSEKIADLDKNIKLKNYTIKLFKSEFYNKSLPIVERVDIVNSLANLSQSYEFNKESTKILNGFGHNKFIFKNEIHIEHPLKYFHRLMIEYLDGSKCKKISIDKNDFSRLNEIIKIFCFKLEDYLMESKSIIDLINDLKLLKSIRIGTEPNIYYDDGLKIINVKNESPGTRANILMEYIVYKNTNIPLLIDQPEDNIDNRTIFNKFTKWFEQLKNKRQVIVVTHDANIVVNSDSENIILCEQVNENDFKYTYGALEFKNNIEEVSSILEGGRDAVERRLLKYGQYKNI